MNRLLTGTAVIAVIAGFLVWWFQPSQVLKRRTKSLMETLTLAEGAGAASRNLKIYPLSRAIGDEVRITGAGDRRAEGVFTRNQIESGFSWLTRSARFTRFQTRRIESVTIQGNQGVVRAIVDTHVELQQQTPLHGQHNVSLTWSHDGDSWRLTSADWDAP